MRPLSQRLGFVLRVWLAEFFSGPLCPLCDERHGTHDIADDLRCSMIRYQRKQAVAQKQLDAAREPKRLLSSVSSRSTTITSEVSHDRV